MTSRRPIHARMTPVQVLDGAGQLLSGSRDAYNADPANGRPGRTLFEAVCVAAGLPVDIKRIDPIDIASGKIDLDAVELAQLALGFVCNAIEPPLNPGDSPWRCTPGTEQAFLDHVAQGQGLLYKGRPLGQGWALGVLADAAELAAEAYRYRAHRHDLDEWPGIS